MRLRGEEYARSGGAAVRMAPRMESTALFATIEAANKLLRRQSPEELFY